MKFSSSMIDHRFRSSVDKALKSVERILDVNRNPRLAEHVVHDYQNKYDLANFVTNTALIAILNVLEQAIGLTPDVLESLDKSRATTLRFQRYESCQFLKHEIVSVPLSKSVQTSEDTKTTGDFQGTTKKSSISKVVTEVHEYHWNITVGWEIFVFSGNNEKDKQVVKSRETSIVLVTRHKNDPIPIPAHKTHTPHDVSLTWLLKNIDFKGLRAQFTIDTEHPDTKTPYRNPFVEAAMNYVDQFQHWCIETGFFFRESIQHELLKKHNPAKNDEETMGTSLSSLYDISIFCPIEPWMEESSTRTNTIKNQVDSEKSFWSVASLGDKSEKSPILSEIDLNKLLKEQLRTIDEAIDSLHKSFPPKDNNKLISIEEATVALACCQIENLVFKYRTSMEYIENMLREQLVAAIGKTITSEDLAQFMKHHNAKLLDPPPESFCYNIRRPHHYPDGLLSIECLNGDNKMEPIQTLVRQVKPSEPVVRVPCNAATTLELTGNTFLHGWVQHRFQQSMEKSYKLIARARQFSSFILIIGTMMGPDRLDPKDAIIVQNKDELLVPLLLNELPTSEEFRDAIHSLSPEQQRFAKAFRSMQLESSVFGVCIIQIKPQLEALLGLPEDALTKEMQLTQDLMELFVDYQVPSDLLSYNGGNVSADLNEKVSNVKGHVKSVMEVIAASKTKQLEEATMRADMEVEEMTRGIAGSRKKSYRVKPRMKTSYVPMARAAMLSSSERDDICDDDVSEGLAFSCVVSANEAVPDVGGPWNGNGSQERRQESTSDGTNDDLGTFESTTDGTNDDLGTSVNFSLIPKMIDTTIAIHDSDSSIRSTIIKSSDTWTRMRQENLLTGLKSSTLTRDEIQVEKNKAMDLLDALSQSGAIPIACSELHVIVSVTHCFDNDVMGTVVEDNINPIEKLERSTLLVASSIYRGVIDSVKDLVRDPKEKHRLMNSFPTLLPEV